MAQATTVECPKCGATIPEGQDTCEYCGIHVHINATSVNDIPASELGKHILTYQNAVKKDPENQDFNTSLAYCHMRMKQYDRASAAFDKAIDLGNGEADTFFYTSVCRLGGKKAFIQPRPVIDKILTDMETATMLEDKGIYHYFIAYIKQDYFARKCYRISPDWQAELRRAKELGVSPRDIGLLFTIMGVERPAVLQ